MRLTTGLIVAASISLLFMTYSLALAQSSPRRKCPAVQAANPQEALMMEAASTKEGCWERLPDGLLVFISDKAPDKNGKPVLKSNSSATKGKTIPAVATKPLPSLQVAAAEAKKACEDDPLFGTKPV